VGEIDHRTLVKQWAAAVNAHDLDRTAALFGEESLILDLPQLPLRTEWGQEGTHAPGLYLRGRERVERYYGEWFAAVPDLRVILAGLVAAGDQIAVEFTLQGTHLGPLLDLPPGGNRIGVRAVAVLQLLHGKIHEQRLYYDLATLERQIGAAPRARGRSSV
jgi:steroid delta-isomerase-like uncharacterized protein